MDNEEPFEITAASKRMSTRAKTRLALLIMVGGLTYAVANNAVKPSHKPASGPPPAPATATAQLQASSAATTQAAGPAISTEVGALQAAPTAAAPSVSGPPTPTTPAPSPATPIHSGAGTKIYPLNTAVRTPQIRITTQDSLLADPNLNAKTSAAPKSKMPRSSIAVEATPVIEPSERAIPLLGPVIRENGLAATVIPPFLLCTVEIREHGVLVSHQTIGCTQSDAGERPAMLMEFGQEVPNQNPNMKYWLSVQVDGYRKGYPILRTRMELKGLLGRATGRRKYESVTVVEPDKKHTVIAFNIDDDDFEVTVAAKKQY